MDFAGGHQLGQLDFEYVYLRCVVGHSVPNKIKNIPLGTGCPTYNSRSIGGNKQTLPPYRQQGFLHLNGKKSWCGALSVMDASVVH